jgi:hypothetical protein
VRADGIVLGMSAFGRLQEEAPSRRYWRQPAACGHRWARSSADALTALLIAGVLVCVPALTRATEQARTGHASIAFRFSKSVEKPPEKVNPIRPIAQVVCVSSLEAPQLRLRPHSVVSDVVPVSPARRGPQSLRAPPPDAVHA